MPLTGYKVLDFTQVLAGPFCTQMLGDMGAEVIKLEALEGDRSRNLGARSNGVAVGYLNLNRNKKSLPINLKHAEGRRIVQELLPGADVVVENFKPGTMAKFGLEYEALATDFPRLVYCSMSGFGQTGPRREDPAFDQIIQGFSGFMSITGSEEGGPMRAGPPIADLTAGLVAVQGIVLALLEREKSGRGQLVDISMLDSMLPLLGFTAWEFLHSGEPPRRYGNHHPILAPSGTFRTRDGHINISLTGESMWRRLCRALGEESWLTDPRFATNEARLLHREELIETLEERLQEKTRDEWIGFFLSADIPCGPIHTLPETFADSQVLAREMVRVLDHPRAGPVRVLAHPVRLGRTPARYDALPPALGENTAAILGELGYSAEQIVALREQNVVA